MGPNLQRRAARLWRGRRIPSELHPKVSTAVSAVPSWVLPPASSAGSAGKREAVRPADGSAKAANAVNRGYTRIIVMPALAVAKTETCAVPTNEPTRGPYQRPVRPGVTRGRGERPCSRTNRRWLHHPPGPTARS